MFSLRLPFIKVIRLWSFLMVISIVLFVADSRGTMTRVFFPISWISRPAIMALSWSRAGVGHQWTVLTSSFTDANRLQVLEKQYNELLLKQQSLAAVLEENTVLRKQLALPEIRQKSLILANFIKTNDRAVIVFDQPETIAPGTIVSSGGNMIGTVVSQKSATVYNVLLITNAAFKAKAKVLHGNDRVEGLVVGQYGDHLELSHVLTNAQIAVDDLVVLSDDDHPEYSGLILGKIQHVVRNDVEVFQEAKILPLLDFTTIQSVVVQQ